MIDYLLSFWNNGNEQLKIVPIIDDIYEIIPREVFDYFPIAKTSIRQEEFEYIAFNYIKIYKNSLRGNIDKNSFFVSSPDGLRVDLMSNSEHTRNLVKHLKERHEVDKLIKKYSYSENLREAFQNQPCHIDFLLMKHQVDRIYHSKQGDLLANYYIFAVEFRSSYMEQLFNKMPKFHFGNICLLSQEIESYNNEEFWEEYNEFWRDFGYDEAFTMREYQRAFEYVDGKNQNTYIKMHFGIVLLRLSKRDLLNPKSYAGIDGIYYFLAIADYAIKRAYFRNWVIEGLKWYGERKEIESFCRINGLKYPIVDNIH